MHQHRTRAEKHHRRGVQEGLRCVAYEPVDRRSAPSDVVGQDPEHRQTGDHETQVPQAVDRLAQQARRDPLTPPGRGTYRLFDFGGRPSPVQPGHHEDDAEPEHRDRCEPHWQIGVGHPRSRYPKTGWWTSRRYQESPPLSRSICDPFAPGTSRASTTERESYASEPGCTRGGTARLGRSHLTTNQLRLEWSLPEGPAWPTTCGRCRCRPPRRRSPRRPGPTAGGTATGCSRSSRSPRVRS